MDKINLIALTVLNKGKKSDNCSKECAIPQSNDDKSKDLQEHLLGNFI